jgi:hypothetical protein
MYTDPVPPPLTGNPEVVSRFATSYQRTADALRTAAQELLALSNTQVSIGEAVDAVRAKAQEAHTGITRVATRYEGASRAYSGYEVALADAKSKADRARSLISGNNGDAAYWRERKAELTVKVTLNGGSDAEQVKDLTEATHRVRDYDQDAAGAMTLYNEAVDDKHVAVITAMHALETAAEASKLNDDFFQSLVGAGQELYQLAQKYLAPILKELRSILELIKKIVDILALVFTILALFIPALGPIALALTVVSLALAAAIFLCSLVLFALGKATLGQVVSDGISLVIGIVTSKLGGTAVFGGTGAFTSEAAGSLVGAATGTAVKTVLTTVLKSAGEGMVEDIPETVASDGLQETVSPFPSVAGPAWGSNDTQLGGETWHLPTTADLQGDLGSFAVDEGKNVASIVPAAGLAIAGYDFVSDSVDNLGPLVTTSLTY